MRLPTGGDASVGLLGDMPVSSSIVLKNMDVGILFFGASWREKGNPSVTVTTPARSEPIDLVPTKRLGYVSYTTRTYIANSRRSRRPSRFPMYVGVQWVLGTLEAGGLSRDSRGPLPRIHFELCSGIVSSSVAKGHTLYT